MANTPWEFESVEAAREAATKYGYREPIGNGWFILIDEKERVYKPTVLTIESVTYQ